MAFIPAPNAIRVCLQFEWTGQIVEVCIGILKSSAVTLPDLSDVRDDVEAWRVAELRPILSSDVTCLNWYLLSLATATSPSMLSSIAVDAAGTNGAGTVPNNSTLVTTFATDLRGRSYRGRAYWPGITTASLLDAVTVLTPYAAAQNSAFASLNGYLRAGYAHAIISYQNAGVMRTTAARTPVTGYRTEVKLDSQRRRLAGRGS